VSFDDGCARPTPAADGIRDGASDDAREPADRRQGSGGEMVILSVKSQCERIDDRKYPSGTSAVVYVRRQNAPRGSEQELFIGSLTDAYAGFYRRCESKR
jgi:hypothetical protein